MKELQMDKVEAFMGKAVLDLSASFNGVMVVLGHKLGFYAALAEGGAQTASDLARGTGTHERYTREWLNQQAASGYLRYHADGDSYELPAEHALVLARDDGPAFFPPAYDTVSAMWHDQGLALEAFRTGRGVGWHEHHHALFHATEAFFRPGYRSNLTTSWIPALSGIEERLQRGGKIADIGCGHGASSIIMAQAYPQAQVFGFDYHQESIDVATKRAQEAGVGDRVHFEVASARDYSGADYDLICYMDSLHDMGDPVGAARHTREALAPGGSVLLVEPFAGDQLTDNLNPVGAMFYAASTVLCVPNSLSQEVGLGLGAQAGPKRLSEVFSEAGFDDFRTAAQTPFNLVLEAKK